VSTIFHLILCLASLFGAPDSTGQPVRRPTLAVLSLTPGKGIDSAAVQQLTEQLETDILATGRIRLLERRQIRNILAEQGFQQSGACDSSDCQVQVGRLLGVEEIVVGETGREGQVTTLAARVVSISTGAILSSHIVDVKGGLDAMARVGVPEVAGVLMGTRKAPATRELLTDKRTFWLPWIVGGGAVLLGGGAWFAWQQMETPTPAPARSSYSVTVETR